MTAPLSVSAIQPFKHPKLTGEVESINQILSEVKALIFNPDIIDLDGTRFSWLRVLEFTYGFRIGGRKNGVSTLYVDGSSNSVLGRLIETQGFVLALKPTFIERLQRIKEQKHWTQTVDELVEIALHSLEHALQVLAPQFTGFEPQLFWGGYDYLGAGNESFVYVYDSEEGGSGGYASLMQESRRFVEMIRQVSRRLSCPVRECQYACKHCLYIENCGMVNRKLNRQLLLDLQVFSV
jgi:hypothetical protein